MPALPIVYPPPKSTQDPRPTPPPTKRTPLPLSKTGKPVEDRRVGGQMGLGELKEKGSLLGHPQVHGGRQGVLKSLTLPIPSGGVPAVRPVAPSQMESSRLRASQFKFAAQPAVRLAAPSKPSRKVSGFRSIQRRRGPCGFVRLPN
jgi:hypothetical protein